VKDKNMNDKNEHIFKAFLKYITFNILGMVGLSCYILADTYFIAKAFGANGLTSLNLAIPVYSFINGIGLMIGMGGATRYSILSGQNKKNDMNIVFTRAVKVALILSVALVFLGIFYGNNLSSLLGADSAVHKMTSTYLSTILIFSPAFFLNNILICFIRNDGDPKLSMAAMIIGSLSNIVLDYIFIFPLQMGMFGAAFATGLAPIISMLLLSTHFFRKRNGFKLLSIHRDFKQVKDIVALGSASFIIEVSAGIVMIIFNMIILKIEGNVGVAAYGIIANLALVGTSIFNGLAQGIQPMVSKSYGSGDYINAKKLLRYAVITACILAVSIYAIIFNNTNDFVHIFNEENNEYLKELANKGLRLYFTAFVFVGINVVTATYFSATDKPMNSFVITILRGIIFIIPIAYLLSVFFGMTGVWISLTCAEVLTTIVAIIMQVKIKKKK
jgi:putative MATE family efflux protein